MEIKYNDCVLDSIRRNKGGYVTKYYPYSETTGRYTSEDVNLFNIMKK